MIVLFYADWCPACQMFKPEWQALEQDLAGEIPTESINTSNEKLVKSREHSYGIDIAAIPTIVILKDGKAEKYEGARNAKSIAKYARSIV